MSKLLGNFKISLINYILDEITIKDRFNSDFLILRDKKDSSVVLLISFLSEMDNSINDNKNLSNFFDSKAWGSSEHPFEYLPIYKFRYSIIPVELNSFSLYNKHDLDSDSIVVNNLSDKPFKFIFSADKQEISYEVIESLKMCFFNKKFMSLCILFSNDYYYEVCGELTLDLTLFERITNYNFTPNKLMKVVVSEYSTAYKKLRNLKEIISNDINTSCAIFQGDRRPNHKGKRLENFSSGEISNCINISYDKPFI